jgi:hypothetical protein
MDDSFSAGLDDDLSGFDEGASDLSSDGQLDSDIPGDLDGDIGGDDLDLDTGDSDFSLDSDLDAGSDSGNTADSDSLEFDMDDQEEGAAVRAGGRPGIRGGAISATATLPQWLDAAW